MKRTVKALLLFTLLSFTAGCAGMSTREQRMLSGGAIGAGTGAAIGGLTGGDAGVGALIGGGAGVVGGAIVDESYR